MKSMLPSGISRLASLSVGLTAGTYRNSEYRTVVRFLVYLYYTQPSTSTFGQNHAYRIQIFTVLVYTEIALSCYLCYI